MDNSHNIAEQLQLIRPDRNSSPELFSEAEGLDSLCFTSENWSAAAFREEAVSENGIMICAMKNGIMAGLICGYFAADESDVAVVAVRPDMRRLGIGKLLMNAFEQALPEATETIFLDVRESNAPAIGLYEGHGYERVGLRRNYYREPAENAVIMKKNLNKRV
ncbi:MAG: ribosomal protein S18-alanine N-acetyltransferase [Alistipes sp.]|nr:ribosomal protein S18-alanine N-acetyltransferase [Alistipes sp.]